MDTTALKQFKTLFVVFCLTLFGKILFGFPTQQLVGQTHSHSDITKRGVYIAVSAFLENNGLANGVNSVVDYFGSGKF